MKLFSTQRTRFPNPRDALSDGVVAMGDEMDVETLLEAYSFGIFPWPNEDWPVLWFCPEKRGVLDFQNLHISKSLQKVLRKHEFKVTFNQAFEDVIRQCARTPRKKEAGTWITENLAKAYTEFHQAGYAHSVEVWLEEKLVGGLYGVYVAGVFSGESMFYRRDNASKVGLVHLVRKLEEQGLTWMDTQMVTPNLKALGGHSIPQEEFLVRLEQAKKKAKSLSF